MLFVTGCAKNLQPAPVDERPQPPPRAEVTVPATAPSTAPAGPRSGASGVTVRPLPGSSATSDAPTAASPPPPAMAGSAVSDNAAVVALAGHASRDVEAARLSHAAAGLERALRIEPDNAGLWRDLADVRFKQGHLADAEQLAIKSVTLAGEPEVTRSGWSLIARIRTARGDVEGAREARRMGARDR